MMAAMMLPSAIPTLHAFSRLSRTDKHSRWHSLVFVLGYLIVWFAFSIVLTVMQWHFHGLAWLTPMMDNGQPLMAALILFMAGLYQLTPLKNNCLQHCRTPFGFLLNEWRPGFRGALHLGLKHGLICLGCCWAVMLIMFALGIMTLWAMALLTLLVILEKWANINIQRWRYGSSIVFMLWAGYFLIP